jgi:hypothetical protein
MAKQHGSIKLTGQLGGISFYEMDGNYYARRKTAHSAERIRTDPKFAKTYRNGLDFGTASRASKLLRKALRSIVAPFADNRMAGRMTGLLTKVVASDSIHTHGKRRASSGDLALLNGFEFNKHQALCLSPKVFIDRVSGLVKISLPSVSASHGATSSLPRGARIVAGIVSINFEKGTYTRHQQTCLVDELQGSSLKCRVPVARDLQSTIIVTLGVTMDINNINQENSSASDSYQAMAIVGVSTVSAGRTESKGFRDGDILSSRVYHIGVRSSMRRRRNSICIAVDIRPPTSRSKLLSVNPPRGGVTNLDDHQTTLFSLCADRARRLAFG